MKEVKDKDNKVNLFFRLMMFFTIGCFVGCIFETFLCYFQRGYFESRKGLVYGPFNPVYGFGVVVIVYALEHKKKNISIFITGALLGGGIEYICSWIQEKVFGTLSWNYSKYFLNFDGRTSLYHMFWWGVLAFIFIKCIYPFVLKLIYKIKEKYRLILSICLLIFFIIDSLISSYACIRQKQRIDKISATTKIEKYFDKNYPDSRVNKLFPNRRLATTHQKVKNITR